MDCIFRASRKELEATLQAAPSTLPFDQALEMDMAGGSSPTAGCYSRPSPHWAPWIP